MQCKKCGETFQRGSAHDVWELKRQHVIPDQGGESWHVHLADAGVFCSRECLNEYLRIPSDKSGIFSVRKP